MYSTKTNNNIKDVPRFNLIFPFIQNSVFISTNNVGTIMLSETLAGACFKILKQIKIDCWNRVLNASHFSSTSLILLLTR